MLKKVLNEIYARNLNLTTISLKLNISLDKTEEYIKILEEKDYIKIYEIGKVYQIEKVGCCKKVPNEKTKTCLIKSIKITNKGIDFLKNS